MNKLDFTTCTKCNLQFGIATEKQWTVEACNGKDNTCQLNKSSELLHCIGCDKYVENPCKDGFATLSCSNAYSRKLKLFSLLYRIKNFKLIWKSPTNL